MKPPGMTGSGRTLNQRKLCMKIHLTKAVNCLPYMTEDLKFIPRNPPYKHTHKRERDAYNLNPGETETGGSL